MHNSTLAIAIFIIFVSSFFAIFTENGNAKKKEIYTDSVSVVKESRKVIIFHRDSLGNIKIYYLYRYKNSNEGPWTVYRVDYYKVYSRLKQNRIIALNDWNKSWQQPLHWVVTDIVDGNKIEIPTDLYPTESDIVRTMQKEAISFL